MNTKRFFFLTLLAAAISFTACQNDPCADKDCGTGTCDTDGTCLCDAGYEYDANGSCTVLTEGKFNGVYAAIDTCQVTPPRIITYDLIVRSGSKDNDGKVEFTNFGGTPNQGGIVRAVVGDVVGNNITVARQNPDGVERDTTFGANGSIVAIDSFRYYISGTGTIDPSKTPKVISMSYELEEVNLKTNAKRSLKCRFGGKAK